MIDFEHFVEGLVRIAVAVRQTIDTATHEVYHDALGDETTASEWRAFTRAAAKAGTFEWFPRVRELRDALAEFRGAPPLDVEASRAYERVLQSGVYSAEAGTFWSYREVLARCGRAAAEAFQAAGAHAAFATTWAEDKRRERFIAAYTSEARATPATRLLPAGDEPQRQLAGTVEAPAPPSTQEASSVLRMVEERAEKIAPAAQPPKVRKLTSDEWERRRAALQAQARELAGEQSA